MTNIPAADFNKVKALIHVSYLEMGYDNAESANRADQHIETMLDALAEKIKDKFYDPEAEWNVR